ncbi:butyryltransferase [Pectobacterium brasiliense]|uniref:GNAT family N-acetyltransferase n=1 Tax=Pectobacterium brasiliense TaxID=180957 RepID=UPI0001A42BEB|nr:GNAT family N-acetyltransferase [Pectobacterium brasiliense]KGA24619.1 butyryltransferase [Pectobacterium brasiliense]KRF61595.1 butyryltransferase [Pectobacterium brasiliense]MBN3185758.1 GNAT family N-acetyltransferase [Pectobacterium brasiliense]QHG26608.1 GNAT family N-acetyltransferase [Pectobacterium brasiliense]
MVSDISSKTISLRLAKVDDAEFIYKLRVNDKLNKHISSFHGDVNNQKEWLVNYKLKEKNNEEYYYIITRNDTGQPIGTVRLYDFINKNESFCWGSWILSENKTRSAAIESALLVYEIGFTHLGFIGCHFDVRKNNNLVVDFHKKSGAKVVSENNLDYFFVYSLDAFLKLKEKYKSFL